MRSSRPTRRSGTPSFSCCVLSMNSDELVVRHTDAVKDCCSLFMHLKQVLYLCSATPTLSITFQVLFASISPARATTAGRLLDPHRKWTLSISQEQNDALRVPESNRVPFDYQPDTNETIAFTFMLAFPRNLSKKYRITSVIFLDLFRSNLPSPHSEVTRKAKLNYPIFL